MLPRLKMNTLPKDTKDKLDVYSKITRKGLKPTKSHPQEPGESSQPAHPCACLSPSYSLLRCWPHPQQGPAPWADPSVARAGWPGLYGVGLG